MKLYWQNLTAKVDQLSRRERLLGLLVTIVLVWFLMDSLLIGPSSEYKNNLNKQLVSDQNQYQKMEQELHSLTSQPPIDPDIANLSRLQALSKQLLEANSLLDTIQKELVSPEKMAGLLQDILKENNKIKLISLQTLPVVVTDATIKLSVYQHGVTLKIQGRYLELLQYLQTLEQSPWNMLWGNISLVANDYPQSTLTVTIYTLSLDQTWLSI